MTILDYYKEHLTHAFGEERANRILTNSRIYTEPLEARADRQEDFEPENNPICNEDFERRTDFNPACDEDFERNMENSVLPLIGLYRAMLLEGFTEEEVAPYLKALWDIMPEEIKHPSQSCNL